MSLKLNQSGVSAFRVVRILRPLRTINSIPGMAGLVQTIFRSIPSMGNIFLLFTFFILVFGIIGLQLFGGNFQNQCVLATDSATRWTDDSGSFWFCKMD